MSASCIARRIAIVWQSATAPSDLTVRHLVGYGRYVHTPWWQIRDTSADNHVEQAMELADVTCFADRRVTTLSGGQRQKVWLAAALAQEPTVLILDEPTTYLDVTHQLRVLDLVRSLNQERGITVIAVMHDLTQAARYCDRCAILKNGQLTLEGPPDALSSGPIEENFDIEAWITTDPQGKLPVIQPRRPLKEAR
jgi:ABC-type cobalamin/Fe3+-siderophores transport systems, ATPase components